jgi:hypothetical protein
MDVVEDVDWCQAVVNVVKSVHLNKSVNLQKAVLFHTKCVCCGHVSAVQARGEQPWF